MHAKLGGRQVQGNAFTTNGFHPKKWVTTNFTEKNAQLIEYLRSAKMTERPTGNISAISPQVDFYDGLVMQARDLDFPFFVWDPMTLQPAATDRTEGT